MVYALVGAVVALLVFAALKLFTMRGLAARERALREDLERSREGLRQFALEVEGRLDRKLDRLEVLVEEARKILGEELFSREEPLAGERREDRLGLPSDAERQRVLALAAAGNRPEAIAQAVGLLRGEVDLILRLHQSAEEMDRG